MKKITLFSLVLFVFFSCRKDVDEKITGTTYFNPPVINLDDWEQEIINVNASLAGVVRDEAGQPVAGAAVTLNGQNRTTDDKGFFVYNQMTMNAAGTFVLVKKDGYFNGSYRFFPKEGSQNYANIKLLSKTNIGSFASGSGGNVESGEGIKLSFPANSIITAAGQLYNGNVNVAARWIDPTAADLSEVMPGNLQGVNRFNEEVALASYGMMAVELTGDGGQKLNVGNNLKAELTFPVPTELQDNAPDEIPLWYFNEEYGLWQQEGIAARIGNEYVGQVTHFSFWNCDAPFPLVTISGTVHNENGVPIANAWVCVNFASGNGYGACGTTDNDGFFSGKMPANEELTMTISQYGMCYQSLVTNIGPFSVDTDLGIIEVTSPDLVEVTGTVVDCNDEPVTNGWVTLTLGNQFSYYFLEGNNEISTSLFNCDNASELEVEGLDLDGLEESDVLTYPVAPVIDLGEIAACGNVIDEYLTITVGGESRQFVVVGAVDSLGTTYIFAHDPQSTSEQFSVGILANDVGVYDGSVIEWMYSTVIYPTQGMLINECSGLNCNATEVEFTLYGAVGDLIEGSLEGTGDFWDQQQNQYTLPYEIEFSIYRD